MNALWTSTLGAELNRNSGPTMPRHRYAPCAPQAKLPLELSGMTALFPEVSNPPPINPDASQWLTVAPTYVGCVFAVDGAAAVVCAAAVPASANVRAAAKRYCVDRMTCFSLRVPPTARL